MRVGDCVVPLDAAVPAMCGGRRVEIMWLDGYYVVGDWLCEEVSGLCVKAQSLRVALERLRRGVDVVRAEVFY